MRNLKIRIIPDSQYYSSSYTLGYVMKTMFIKPQGKLLPHGLLDLFRG